MTLPRKAEPKPLRQYQRSKIPEGRATHPLVHWIWAEMNRQHASQEDVAKRSGVNSGTMRKWRNGTRSPRLMELEAVINTLGFKLILRSEDHAIFHLETRCTGCSGLLDK